MQAHSKAVILARVSSKSQEDEGYSLDAQLKLMRDYCGHKNLVVAKEFRVAETASKQGRRKVFQELITHINEQKVCHIIVEKTDRLTRNFKDAVTIDEWLEGDEKRVLHLVKENLQLHRNSRSDAKFMLNIYLAFAKKYIDNLREEAMKGWAEKLAQGWLPASPPPGYMTVTENGKKIHVPNPETAPLAQMAFQLYSLPDHTLASVLVAITDMGLLTSKGRPFTKSFMAKVLSNPFYIGINRFNGRDYPGAQEPIIDNDLFEAVETKLHRQGHPRRRKHNPIFQGMIRCGFCGGMISWSIQKGRYYGSCRRLSSECKAMKMLREDRVERLIIKQLKIMDSIDGKALKKAQSVLRAVQQQYVGYYREKTIEALKKQLGRLRHMESTLYEDKLAGQVTQEFYDFKRQHFLEQSNEINERLARLYEVQESKQPVTPPQVESKSELVQLYVFSTPSQKRLIMSNLFRRISAEGDQVVFSII